MDQEIRFAPTRALVRRVAGLQQDLRHAQRADRDHSLLSASLVAQRADRIEVGGFGRGQDTEADSDRAREPEGEGDGPERRVGAREVRDQGRRERGDAVADPEADGAADQAEHQPRLCISSTSFSQSDKFPYSGAIA